MTMNKRLQLAVRKPMCDDCTLGQRDLRPEDRCVTGFGPNNAQWMIVTNYPVTQGSHLHRKMLELFKGAGLDATSAMWVSAVKCRVWDLTPNRTEMKTCKEYLYKEIEHVDPKYIITFGGEAIFPFTGSVSGITKMRGQVIDYNGAKVFPTLSVMLALHKPSAMPSLMSDLRYFYNLMNDTTDHQKYHKPTSDRVYTVRTVDDLNVFRKELTRTNTMAFDIESTGLNEHDSSAKLISLCVTGTSSGGMDGSFIWRLPLYHPDSPWRRKWKNVLRYIGPALKAPQRRIAHNGKHDCRWLRHFGVNGIYHTFDTIMALAVLDENQPKGLKPAAQQILGAEPWGVDNKKLLDMPLDEVLDYNAFDTWHDLRLYYYLREQLLKFPKQGRLFAKLLMPVIHELITVESVGIYVDQEKLQKNGEEIQRRLAVVENTLDSFLPLDPAEIPDKFVAKRSREIKVNWGPSDFARWFLFDYLKLPIIKTGKTQPNGQPGKPSMDRTTLLFLQDKHEAVPTLLERAKWSQLNNTFIKPYTALLGSDSRLRTVFKPWGAVTGRTTSGKEDAEKISGGVQGQGLNLQQVPNEPLVRGVLGAQPGWLFVTADQSQIELRIAGFYSQDSNLLHVYQTNQDVHTLAAMHMTGKSKSLVTKEERRRAKARNFGFLYGMGWRKFIIYAFTQYDISFSEAEARANRQSFFDQFPGLSVWHSKQKRLVHKYGRVETPMGRVRHLPDIYSPDEGVRAEAERQAINSPVQAMASDICLISMVEIAKEFKQLKLRARVVGFVHDAVNFEIHQDDIDRAIPIIKREMENPPLERMFNLHLNVPLKTDISVGFHWSEGVELPENAPDWQTTIDLLLEERTAA